MPVERARSTGCVRDGGGLCVRADREPDRRFRLIAFGHLRAPAGVRRDNADVTFSIVAKPGRNAADVTMAFRWRLHRCGVAYHLPAADLRPVCSTGGRARTG